MKKILIFLFISIILLGGIFYFYKENEKQQRIETKIKEIKDSYSSFVETKKDKVIYKKENKKYKKVGAISKETIIPLEKKKVKDEFDIYYQIKDTNYYIDYKDIKASDGYEDDKTLDNYVVTNSIKTNPTKLYQDGKIVLALNETLEFDVLSTDNNKHYVKYLGKIYSIENSFELIEKQIEINLLKDISVLSFNDNISNTKLEEILKYLNESNYQSININDFKLWVNNNISLEDNKVLLLYNKELDETKLNLSQKYNLEIINNTEDITFVSDDVKIKVGDTKYYKYDISSNTTLNRVKDMLKGIKEKKIFGQGIAVLNYHFFYDSSIGEQCNESICLDVSNFRKQLDYLKQNGYKTLTMKEFNDWMDKKITLPKKSVLITIDDGAMGTSKINGNKLIPILEEYQMNATLFLITGWWSLDNYRSEYLEVHSHGHELHYNNYCANGNCGVKGLILSKNDLISDLKLSTNTLGTNLAFCYPFYAYNSNYVNAVKESGFSLAFAGGGTKAYQTSNKYAVPRYAIYKNTSLNTFINMVS